MNARPFVLVVLLLSASLGATAQTGSDTSQGRRVDFALAPFRDTLFTALEAAYRVRLDDDGHVWYTSEGGLVEVDPDANTRALYTKLDGLPSSYSIGLALHGKKVYVGTDLGLAILDRATGTVETVRRGETPLPDDVLIDVARIGDDLWLGTQFAGVAIWNTTRPATEANAWTFKNTSTTPLAPAAIRRIVATPDAVWVATDGNGAWRYDRSTRAWNVTLAVDGLPDNRVNAVAVQDKDVWFATSNGLSVRNASGGFRTYWPMHGLPSYRVLDVDILSTRAGTVEVFAATGRGLWQLDPVTGRNMTRAQSWIPGFDAGGILGSYMYDSEPTRDGWLFATQRGVSFYRDDNDWRYYATGPSDGPSWGPLSFGYTAAGVGDASSHLWFGTSRGLSAYRLPSSGFPGYWQNFGEWQNYPAAPATIHWVDTAGNTTWFATSQGAYAFEHQTGRWITKHAADARNLVYGLDATSTEVWIGLFGEGLIMENLTTGVSRSWTQRSRVNPIPDPYITDVRLDGDNVWLGASLGVLRLDAVTGIVRNQYTVQAGLPSDGYTFRVVPDGPVVWVGTRSGGVAQLDVATGHVSRVWNATRSPGFPDSEVRALHREGNRLWVGTKDGLARIDLSTGAHRSWNQSNSDLVQDFVNGITSAGGILYLATLSGVHRMEIATETFLPMRDGPGVVRGEPVTDAPLPSRVSVRIHAPRDGEGVTGESEIRGSAFILGSTVDRVEVRVGDGPWRPATGNESWSLRWNASDHPPNVPVRIEARAFSGNASGVAEIAVTPVAPPKVPLRVEEIPPGEAYAGRAFSVAARAEGDDPLRVQFVYRPSGAHSFERIGLIRQGGLFTGTIPAHAMVEGPLSYYFEAQSGLLTERAGGDARAPSVLDVLPAPRVAVTVEAPPKVEANAGAQSEIPLNLTNVGTREGTFRIASTGLRAAWLHVPPDDITLAPGGSRSVVARFEVPATAFADNTTFTFEVRDTTGEAQPAIARVPVAILAADASRPADPSPAPAPDRVIPSAPLLVAALVALALAGRRRRA